MNSERLRRSFSQSLIPESNGEAKMERLPNALGPHSMGPPHRATTEPSASISATRSWTFGVFCQGKSATDRALRMTLPAASVPR